MPKMKTNKTAAKRFKVTGNGRVRRPKSGGNHGLINKSRKRLRTTLEQVVASAPVRTPNVEPTTAGATGQRVLVVDDNEVNQLVAAGILRHLGYAVEIADDGAKGVAAAIASRFHAILMDVQMPELDGYAATAEIRRLEGPTRHTPIIAMTATASAEERTRCLAAGMDDYLTKPMRRADVAAILSTWVPSI